jgi:parallel beta-helix repeat protein
MKKVAAIWIGMFVIASSMFVTFNAAFVAHGKPAEGDQVMAPPFRINSNADFATYASGGDGSPGTPWILENMDVNGSGVGYCVYIGNTTEFFILRNNTLHEASGGSGGLFYPDAGLELYNATNGIADNNTISNNTGYGAFVLEGPGNTIYNNTIMNNSNYGVFTSIGNTYIRNNSVTGTVGSGIVIYQPAGCIIDGNTVNNNSNHGIMLVSDTDNNVISNNTANYNNGNGISLSAYCDNNIVENNTANDNSMAGILAGYLGQFNVIKFNNVLRNYHGINFDTANDSFAYDNNASDNDYAGIYLYYSAGLDMTGNIMYNNGVYIYGTSLIEWNTHNIDATNTVNAKPVYYWKNQTGGTAPAGAGQVILANCSGVTVENQDVSNSSIGIQLGFSSNNTIANNTASNNANSWNKGISLAYDACNNTIWNNTVRNNFMGISLLTGCDNNTIQMNNVSNNENEGVYMEACQYNTVFDNNVSMSGCGIDALGSDNNTMKNNTAYDCSAGIIIQLGSQYNTATENKIYMPVNYGFFLRTNSGYNNMTNNSVQLGTGTAFQIDSNDLTTNFNKFYNNTISDVGNAFVFLSPCNNTIADNTISNFAGNGIYLWGNGRDNSLDNNTISDVDVGIRIEENNNNTLSKNIISNIPAGSSGIFITSSANTGNDNTIRDNTIQNGGTSSYGIYAGSTGYSTNWNRIINNTIADMENAIYFFSSTNNAVANNTISGATRGIDFVASNNNDILNNTISSTTNGIYLESGSSNNNVSDNTATTITHGIGLWTNCINNTISNNTILSSGSIGIRSWNCNNNTISKNNISNVPGIGPGIRIESTTTTGDDNIVRDNIIANCGVGINSTASNNNRITGNTINATTRAIETFSSNGLAITGNTLYTTAGSSTDGIRMELSSSCDVRDNTIRYCQHGMHMTNGNLNTIFNNTITNTSNGVFGIGIYTQSNNNQNVISNNTLEFCNEGIRPVNFNWGKIENNSVLHSMGNYGINLAYSSNNSILYNTIHNRTSTGGYGLDFYESNDNVVAFNTVDEFYYGLDIYASSWNDVHDNNISMNSYGVSLFETRNNTVRSNWIYLNSIEGMNCSYAFDNLIYGNRFIANAVQAFDNGTNSWNASYSINGCGNYWSDYVGVDHYMGAGQDVPGSDGIGDTQYNISGGSNADHYPLYFDSALPVSSLNAITPYWRNSIGAQLNATATDDSTVTAVELWSNYSADNVTWGGYAMVANDTNSADNWSFAFPSAAEGYYSFFTRAWDASGNYEDAPIAPDATVGIDASAPNSSVNSISPYLNNSSPLTINANASDNLSGVSNTILLHRFSTDNSSWGAWTAFGTDAAAPWEWAFSFPSGDGYYQFYTNASDIAGNVEGAPAQADAVCLFDSHGPIIAINGASSGNLGTNYNISAQVTDQLSSVNAVFVLYWFGTGGQTNASLVSGAGGAYSLAIALPTDSTDTLHFIIAAVDMAGNWNLSTVYDVAIIDDVAPTANAGQDLTITSGTLVTFDGLNSSDNIGIANYTWTFTYNGSQISLYEAGPQFRFWTDGEYIVTLNVSDAGGNSDTDTLAVTVQPIPVDTDNDGLPDTSDTDDDNDGSLDSEDAFPLDATESVDTDADGVGNNADTDDDGDGVPDAEDTAPLDPDVTGKGGIGDYWWLVLIVIIVVVVLIALMVMRKPKEKEPGFETAPTKPDNKPQPQTKVQPAPPKDQK